MNPFAPVKRQDGFTVIEVLVASFILVLGALAVFMTFSAAVRNVQRGKETQVGLSVAQREMEKIRSLPYEKIALKTTPVNSTETTNPNNRVSGSTFNLNRTGAANYASMVISSSGEVEPSTSAFSGRGDERDGLSLCGLAQGRRLLTHRGEQRNGELQKRPELQARDHRRATEQTRKRLLSARLLRTAVGLRQPQPMTVAALFFRSGRSGFRQLPHRRRPPAATR